MMLRWLTGLLFGVVALACAWGGSLAWLGFLGVLLAVATGEWRQLGNLDDRSVDVAILLAGLIIVGAGVTGQFQYLSLLLPLLLFPGIMMMSRRMPARSRNMVWTAAGMLWLALPAALLFLVRYEFGLGILLVLLIGTIAQDTVALYSGMLFGGDRPFAPALSPNKTWAGFTGNVVGSVAVYLLAGEYFGWPVNLTVSLGLLLGVMGQFGDLSVSGLKRRRELDDTGGLFPGHGGILDRVDGLIFNVTIFYPFCFWLESYA